MYGDHMRVTYKRVLILKRFHTSVISRHWDFKSTAYRLLT